MALRLWPDRGDSGFLRRALSRVGAVASVRMGAETRKGCIMIQRRAVLVTGAAAAVVAIGAGWALSRTPRRAQQPWRAAQAGFGDPRLDALAFAILAPSPHNMQPWRLAFDGADGVRVMVDPTRLLPETDPLSRQIVIGFGCFLEMLRLAGAASGHRADITAFPEGEDGVLAGRRPLAAVRLVEDASVAVDPLFEAALTRRTNRAPYDQNRPVARADLNALAAASVAGVRAEASGDAAFVAELRALASEAWAIEWGYEPTRRESLVVTRIGKAEIDTEPWGLSLTGPVMEGLNAVGVLTLDAMDQPGSSAYDQSQQFYERACQTAMAFVWTVSATNTRRDQLDAGRAWVRIQLEAARRGVAFQPLSQPLQEYPPMAGPYARAHAVLAPDGGTVQMLARLGYAASPPPSPREPLETKLLEL